MTKSPDARRIAALPEAPFSAPAANFRASRGGGPFAPSSSAASENPDESTRKIQQWRAPSAAPVAAAAAPKMAAGVTSLRIDSTMPPSNRSRPRTRSNSASRARASVTSRHTPRAPL